MPIQSLTNLNRETKIFFNILLIIFLIGIVFSMYYKAEEGFVLSSFIIFIMFVDKRIISKNLEKFPFLTIIVIFSVLAIVLSSIIDNIEITTNYTEKAIFLLLLILFISTLFVHKERMTKFQIFSIFTVIMIGEVFLFFFEESTYMHTLLFISFIVTLIFEPIRENLVKYIKKT